MSFWQFVSENRADIWRHTLEHLGLVAMSTLVAVAIGVPLGIAIARSPRLRGPILDGHVNRTRARVGIDVEDQRVRRVVPRAQQDPAALGHGNRAGQIDTGRILLPMARDDPTVVQHLDVIAEKTDRHDYHRMSRESPQNFVYVGREPGIARTSAAAGP